MVYSSLKDDINLYNVIYSKKDKFPLVNKLFYSNITKILLFAYRLCPTNLLDEKYKLVLLEKIKKIEDKNFFNYFGEKEEKALKNNDDNKKDIKDLKEKLKKKYNKKNEIIKEKNLLTNMIVEEEIKNEEVCVYCRQFLENDSNNFEYYGKICYYFSDFLTDIFRKKPEEQRKKENKFVTCNHKMHFKCFNEFIYLHLKGDSNDFECPLCKKL